MGNVPVLRSPRWSAALSTLHFLASISSHFILWRRTPGLSVQPGFSFESASFASNSVRMWCVSPTVHRLGLAWLVFCLCPSNMVYKARISIALTEALDLPYAVHLIFTLLQPRSRAKQEPFVAAMRVRRDWHSISQNAEALLSISPAFNYVDNPPRKYR